MNNNVNQEGLCSSALLAVGVQLAHLTPLTIRHNDVLNSVTADTSSIQMNSPVSKMLWKEGFNRAVCGLYRLVFRVSFSQGHFKLLLLESGWETKRICENLPWGMTA